MKRRKNQKNLSPNHLLDTHKMATIVVHYLHQKHPDRLYTNSDLLVKGDESAEYVDDQNDNQARIEQTDETQNSPLLKNPIETDKNNYLFFKQGLETKNLA